MKDQVPKYLGDQVKYFSTACVLNEVESLGEFEMTVFLVEA